MQFDVDTKRGTFFEAHDTMRRDPGKFPIYEMPPGFDSTLAAGPSQQHGTLQNFLECCLSMEKYPNALTEIASLLHRTEKGQNESTMNSLHKKKIGKKIRVNI